MLIYYEFMLYIVYGLSFFTSQVKYLIKCQSNRLRRCLAGTCPSDWKALDQVTSQIFQKGTQLSASHMGAPLFSIILRDYPFAEG